MRNAIKNFPRQFQYQPVIENKNKLANRKKFIVLGMGGSNLAPELLKIRDPYIDIHSHKNYDLPKINPRILKESLIIASSYSGNTEETISGFQKARKLRFASAVITTGGKLLALAKKYQIPYIHIPATSIQPRMALGYSTIGLASLMRLNAFIKELRKLESLLETDNSGLEKTGKKLAQKISGHVPVIYSSLENAALAYNWKIKFNETGKMPAFANSFPELNHNEIAGFDSNNDAQNILKNFYFLFLNDKNDCSKIKNRIKITANLCHENGLPVEIIPVNGLPIFHKIFRSLLLADWTAYYVAETRGIETEKNLLIEKFKKIISQR